MAFIRCGGEEDVSNEERAGEETLSTRGSEVYSVELRGFIYVFGGPNWSGPARTLVGPKWEKF